jgi:hypothetical protein
MLPLNDLSKGTRFEVDHAGVEPLHVGELHPDGAPVAEHVDVSLAPDERVQVDLVLVDQALGLVRVEG